MKQRKECVVTLDTRMNVSKLAKTQPGRSGMCKLAASHPSSMIIDYDVG